MDSEGTAPHRRLALIVEDDPDAAAVAQGMLAALGWTSQVASDGREALSSTAELRPQVVLLDVCLPGIDGIGVMKVLRRLREVRPIPVIAASAVYDDESGQARHLRALGVEQFLTKPFRLDQISAALEASGLTVGEPVRPRAPGPVVVSIGGQPIATSDLRLQGSVLEIATRAPDVGAGASVAVETPDGRRGEGTVFSAVPEGRKLRCRIALNDPEPELLEALADAI